MLEKFPFEFHPRAFRVVYDSSGIANAVMLMLTSWFMRLKKHNFESISSRI